MKEPVRSSGYIHQQISDLLTGSNAGLCDLGDTHKEVHPFVKLADMKDVSENIRAKCFLSNRFRHASRGQNNAAARVLCEFTQAHIDEHKELYTQRSHTLQAKERDRVGLNAQG